jgi:soluble cytochrome b562
MIIDFQSAIQRKLLSIPPAARQAYDRANADFRAARRSVATTGDCSASVAAESAELGRKRAAVVVNAKPVTPEQARKNIEAAYQRQVAEGVDALSAAIDKVRASKAAAVKVETGKAEAKTLADLLRESAQERE